MRGICAVMLAATIAASPLQAAEAVVKADYLACNPERLFDRSERLRKSGDEKALKAFTAGALLAGTCIALKSGMTVFTEGQGKGTGIVKVRPQGSGMPFFKSSQALFAGNFAGLVTALTSQSSYADIATDRFPAGEIRGEIIQCPTTCP